MQGQIDKIYGYIIQYGMSFVAAILIFVIGKWVARLVGRVLERVMLKAKMDKTFVSFAKNISYYGIMVFVAIASLTKLGVQTTSFVAVIGAAGLAVGLALQGSLANFAGGVFLILFMPFRAGDTIEAAGAIGVVEEIQIFSTVLTTADKKRVIIPNAKITSDKIIVHARS